MLSGTDAEGVPEPPGWTSVFAESLGAGRGEASGPEVDCKPSVRVLWDWESLLFGAKVFGTGDVSIGKLLNKVLAYVTGGKGALVEVTGGMNAVGVSNEVGGNEEECSCGFSFA